jgi:hypothetical protein
VITTEDGPDVRIVVVLVFASTINANQYVLHAKDHRFVYMVEKSTNAHFAVVLVFVNIKEEDRAVRNVAEEVFASMVNAKEDVRSAHHQYCS